jgi:hypothetical protein
MLFLILRGLFLIRKECVEISYLDQAQRKYALSIDSKFSFLWPHRNSLACTFGNRYLCIVRPSRRLTCIVVWSTATRVWTISVVRGWCADADSSRTRKYFKDVTALHASGVSSVRLSRCPCHHVQLISFWKNTPPIRSSSQEETLSVRKGDNKFWYGKW